MSKNQLLVTEENLLHGALYLLKKMEGMPLMVEEYYPLLIAVITILHLKAWQETQPACLRFNPTNRVGLVYV